MAFPIAFIISYLGALIAFGIRKNRYLQLNPITFVASFYLFFNGLFWVESGTSLQPDLIEVTTQIEINKKPSDVWKHVIQFPEISDNDDLIFKTGISTPLSAEIIGEGVGAIRYCKFTTGSFIEPIIVWDKPHVLKFRVTSNPPPMNEWSFYSNINAPHINGFMTSKMGQFKLVEKKDGKTLLEGTTWYEHNIYPSIYWRLWSNYIIHKIHERVLTHIKKTSENS